MSVFRRRNNQSGRHSTYEGDIKRSLKKLSKQARRKDWPSRKHKKKYKSLDKSKDIEL